MAGAPGIQIAQNFTNLTDLDPILTEIYYQHLGELDPMLETFYRVLTSSKAKETDARIGGFGDPPEFKGQIEYDGADADYEIEYSHTEFANGFKIERKMLDDLQYDGIFSRAEDLAVGYRRKVEKDAASIFNNATSTAGFDGKALLANDHPRSSGDSTAVDNLAALALTVDNLETVRQQGEAQVDDRGELFPWNGDLLLVPNALRKTAHEITMSTLNPENAENASNMFNGLRYLSWNRLTDSNRWFLIDTTMMKRYLKWYWRVRPEFAAVEDFDTMQRKYRGYMRYSFGWSDFRWVVGSEPS